MSVKRYSLSVLVQCALVVSLHSQQTPQISHYMFNTPMYNPASAGFTNSIVASGIHRQQWYGMEGAPQTTLISFDAPLRVINSGLGLNIANEQLGFFNTTTIQLAYNYQIPFLDGTLGMGIHLGMNSFGIKLSEVRPPSGGTDQVLLKLDDASAFLWDIGMGFFYSVPDRYEVGISMGHLNQPRFDREYSEQNYVYKQKRTLNLSGNYNFSLDMFPRIDFVPSALIKSDFTATQVDVSLIGFLDNQFWGGLSYRLGDAVVLLAGLHLREFPIQIGVAYDLATNRMSRASKIGGGFEVFLRYSFNLSVDRVPQSYRNSRFL